MPVSKLGKWTAGLFAVFILSLTILIITSSTGQIGGESFFDNLYLAIPAIFAAVSIIASFVTGLISYFKSKDKSFIVITSILIGAIAVFFIISELIFEH